MIRKETYPVEEILPFLGGVDRVVILDGDTVNACTLRLQNFKVHGITCVTCGLVGKFFAKERTHKDISYHLNLYAVRDDGTEVLMTQDHIIPLSLEGPNQLTNLQTMCAPCNNKKGNGRQNKIYSHTSLLKLLRSSYTPLRKKLDILLSGILGGTASIEDFNGVVGVLNKMFCRHIQSEALKEIPSGVSIQEHDIFYNHFTPIGDRAVIVHGSHDSHGFYIYDKISGDRLKIKFKD